jgi:hypothetical protein
MSNVPFVNQLGDALEKAISDPIIERAPWRRRRPRRHAIVLAVIVALGGCGALAGTLASRLLSANSPVVLAANGQVTCFKTASFKDGAIYAGVEGSSPIPTCAQQRRQSGWPTVALVACGDGIFGAAVIPSSGSGSCKRAGLPPLPAGYPRELAKVQRLHKRLEVLQASAGCIPQAQMLSRAQGVLNAAGWKGWRAVDAYSAPAGGPCGAVAPYPAFPNASGGTHLDPLHRVLEVGAQPYPSTLELLTPKRELALGKSYDTRCYSEASIRALMRRYLAGTSRRVDIATTRAPKSSVLDEHWVQGPQWNKLLAAGCVIFTGLSTDRGGYNVIAGVWRRQ